MKMIMSIKPRNIFPKPQECLVLTLMRSLQEFGGVLLRKDAPEVSLLQDASLLSTVNFTRINACTLGFPGASCSSETSF